MLELAQAALPAQALVARLPKDAYGLLEKLRSQDGQYSEAEFVAIFLAVLANWASPDVFDEAFLERLKGAVLGDRRHRALRMQMRRMMSS